MSSPRKPLRHHLHDYFFPHQRNNYRPHLFSVVSIAVLVLAIILLEAGYLVQTKFVFLKTDFLASVLPGTLVALTNQDRITNGLAGVTEDPLLDKAAQAAADDMAAKGYFAHTSPDGKSPWYWLDLVGYHYSYAGENLAVNFTDSENVETAWMNSPTHRANIEKPQYTKIGIGTANGVYKGKETTFVVSFFATPVALAASVHPTKVTQLQKQITENSANVLGTQTVGTDAGSVVNTDARSAVGADIRSTENVPVQGWFASLLVSPSTTFETILTILFIIIAISLIATLFLRGKAHHHSVAVGATILFVCISGVLFFNTLFSGPIMLPY